MKPTLRATINLGPKIGAAKENFILLPICLFARQRQIIHLPIYLQKSIASAMSYS